jgi:hypothetical protein
MAAPGWRPAARGLLALGLVWPAAWLGDALVAAAGLDPLRLPLLLAAVFGGLGPAVRWLDQRQG